MRAWTPIRLAAAVAVALIAVTLPALVSADDPVEGETVVTHLEPGDNFVGWIGEPLSVHDLFAEMPQIELVYRWDPTDRRYEYALPGVAAGSRPLELLTADTSVVVQIQDQPISVRELFAARPEVQLIYRWDPHIQSYAYALRSVSPDRWSLAVLAAGTSAIIRIGEDPVSAQALFEAVPQIGLMYRYDEADESYAYAIPGLAPAVGGLDTLTPGMGLVVRVGGEEAVEWARSLIPTKGLVELRSGENWVSWAGPDGWSITDVVRGIGRWLTEVQLGDLIFDPARLETAADWPLVKRGDALRLTMSRQVNWLQPTGLMPEILYPDDASQRLRGEIEREVQAVLDFYSEEYSIHADASILSITVQDERCGWAWKHNIFIHSRESECGGRESTLAHEYFHAIQDQLRDSYRSRPVTATVPSWLIEGTAMWAEQNYSVHNSHQTFEGSRFYARQSAARGPSWSTSTVLPGGWEQSDLYVAKVVYDYGMLATDLLVERSDEHAPIEFFRSLHPSIIGPLQDWRDVFSAVFGITVEELQRDFEKWQDGLPGRSHYRGEPGDGSLTGEVIQSDGMPLAGILVFADGEEYFPRGAVTDERGRFELFVPRGSTTAIGIRLTEYGSCARLLYAGDSVTTRPDEATRVHVGSAKLSPIKIVVPVDACRVQIRGRLIDSEGNGVSGVWVEARGEAFAVAPRTDADGEFAIAVPGPGSYRVLASIGDCSVYYSRGGATARWSQATHVRVSDSDVTGIELRLAAGMCEFAIVGKLSGADGSPGRADVQVTARLADGETSVSARISASGYFSLVAPSAGSYLLRVSLAGCLMYYKQDGAVGSRNDASLIQVSDSDVTGVRFQLPRGACAQVRGYLLDADGNGIGGEWVYADSDDGKASVQTSIDGSFAIALPTAGSYRLYVLIDECRIVHGESGTSADWNGGSRIEVTDADIAGIEFRLPEDPASICQ